MNKHNRGVTIVEIIISIAIIGIVLVLLFSMLAQVRHEDSNNNIQSNFIINQSTFIKAIEEDIVNYGVKSIGSCNLADANISSTVVSGYEQQYACLRIEYAADYIKDKIGFLLVYNYYTKYDKIDGTYKGRDPSWMIQYVRGSYNICNSNLLPVYSSWKNETSIMKALPAPVDLSEKPYVLYTALNGTHTNAASVVLPIVNEQGEHYDINLSFTFKGNNYFKCDNKNPNKLACNCKSSSALCTPTYNYTNYCSN